MTGFINSTNIVIDDNEIMARNNFGASDLIVNRYGGHLGIGANAGNLLDVNGNGSQNGGVTGYNEVTAHFKNTGSGHSAVSVDANTDQDAIIYLSENGSPLWSMRTDVSEENGTTIDNVLEFRNHKNGLNQEVLRMYLDPGGAAEYYIKPHGNVSPSLFDEYECGTIGRYWYAVHAHYFYVELPSGSMNKSKSLDYGLKEVLALNPISYSDDANGIQKQGIAFDPAEVAAIIPEATMTDEKNSGNIGVSYNELIPVLVRAIQEQQAEIEYLKSQIGN